MSGGFATALSQGTKFCVNTTGTIILARLLIPEDYGIYGMAMVVVGFAQMFMGAGLGILTIQAKSISHDEISTLFWAKLAALCFKIRLELSQI